MVRCEECLRANAPTRVTCLYCAAVLPIGKTTAELQKPNLRPLQKGEKGYNCILLRKSNELTAETLALVTDLLKLNIDDLERIFSAGVSLPLARAASEAEAVLVQDRLTAFAIQTRVVSDMELGLEDLLPLRVRTARFGSGALTLYHLAGGRGVNIPWAEFSLIVTGRLLVKQVEVKEQKGGRADAQILDARELFNDVAVLDLYCGNDDGNYRILASSFDFSCLGEQKSLLAAENFKLLVAAIRERAAQAEYDDSFNSLRSTLAPVWPAEQQIESRGWRRERPGKYSVGAVIESNNESQFLRYSRLRYYLKRGSQPTNSS